jgi:hypothetical protein
MKKRKVCPQENSKAEYWATVDEIRDACASFIAPDFRPLIVLQATLQCVLEEALLGKEVGAPLDQIHTSIDLLGLLADVHKGTISADDNGSEIGEAS